MKIILDPGHGQYGNRYPANPAYYEGTQMYLLASYLKAELETYSGVEVILTRKNLQDDPALSSRGNMAKGADAFLSLHSNAIGSMGTTAVRGVEIYYTMVNPVPNKALADKLMDTISKAMSTPRRFTTTKGMPNDPKRDYFQVVRSAAAVGCPIAMLIEHGYHTNPADTAFLVKADNLKALAKAEAETIAAHFGLHKQKEENEVKPLQPFNANDRSLIMVTCGNYVLKAKAEEVLERVKLVYPNAGIRKETLGSARWQVVAGRHKGTLKDAEAIGADLQRLTGIHVEVWAW